MQELSRRQAKSGRTIWLLYRVGGDEGWPFKATRVSPRAAVNRRLPRVLVSALFLARALAMIVRRRREIEVVHVHGDYLEAVAAGAVRALGIPSILTLHGRLSPRVLRRAGVVYRLPSHLIAVSSAVADQLASVGVPARRITVQHSGVDRQLFHPPTNAPKMPPFRVVVASALIPLKNHVTLFEAVRVLQQKGLDVRLEIAGSGPERLRLEESAPPQTRFHGQLDRPTLARLMRRCHACALVSVDTEQAGEGTPTSLMEGMACGLPFVATDVGGVANLASRSKAGVIIRPGDVQTLADALRRLATDRQDYLVLRRAALAFAPGLDWDVVAERLDSLMEGLARRREVAGR